ncbi:DUF6878 family protein [Sphingomonas sp.]|uniref:DUF6878 family protein n=1 Tax=Sphingomonas sp. TaxID=28214 RepID=UPI00307E64A5
MTTQNPSADPAAAEARIRAEVAVQHASVTEVTARCKAAFLPLLLEHGVTRVEIYYDGGGDEGSVGDVLAFAGDEATVLPAILCDHFALQYSGAVESRTMQLEDALSAFAENAVCDHHCGWENGEGAHGTITIDVATGTVNLTHNERFIDYDTTEMEL